MVYSVAAAGILTVVANGASATVSAAGAWPSSAEQHYGKYEAGQSFSVSSVITLPSCRIAIETKAAIAYLAPVATTALHTQHRM